MILDSKACACLKILLRHQVLMHMFYVVPVCKKILTDLIKLGVTYHWSITDVVQVAMN